MLTSLMPFISPHLPLTWAPGITQLGAAGSHTLLIPAQALARCGLFLRYSFATYGLWLLDLGAYETPHPGAIGSLVVL